MFASAPALAAARAVACDYDNETEAASPVFSDEECLELLASSPLASTRSNKKFDISTNHDHLRFLCIHRYFLRRCRGEGKIAASMAAATILRAEPTEHQGRCIRVWAQHYSSFQQLPELRQGKYVKTVSYLDDADHANELRALLRAIPRNLRTAAVFREKAIAAYPALNISERAASEWMHRLDFHPYSLTKKTYTDGHERPDAVELRATFISKMQALYPRMESYTGPNWDTIIPPSHSHLSRLVWFNHDESAVDPAGGRQRPWVEEGHAPMLPKRGTCVMVSGFLSPYGMDTDSYVMIEPSADGYWTNRDLINQLNTWLPTLATKYPGCTAVIQFDWSGNHGAMAPDALVASRLNLSDGWPKLTESDKAAGITRVAFRNTRYRRDGVWHDQTFVFTDAQGKEQHKGIKTILMERGLWRSASPIQRTEWTLEDCKARNFNYDTGQQGPQLVMSHREHQEMQLDEALELLANQHDFVAQRYRNWVIETVEAAGHIAVFGAKFHPELAPIELFWGEMKRYLRAHCDYTLDTLRANLPKAIASVPVATVRRQYAHVMRYMRAYEKGDLTLAQVEWAMRKYTSHRRAKDAPANLDELFLAEDWFADMPDTLRS